MPKKTVLIVGLLAMSWAVAVAPTMAATPAEMGRTHFTTQGFAGGSKACSDCHPNGRGLEQAGSKSEFAVMGKEHQGLEEVVNMCITQAIHGQAIATDSKEMRELVSYIRSLGAKAGVGAAK